MNKSTPATALFSSRLRSAREKRNLSQGELAKRSAMHASAISHFETGVRKPSLDNLRRLADALEVTTDYLLGRVTDTDLLAGSDEFYRKFYKLSSNDREITVGVIKLLAKKDAERR